MLAEATPPSVETRDPTYGCGAEGGRVRKAADTGRGGEISGPGPRPVRKPAAPARGTAARLVPRRGGGQKPDRGFAAHRPSGRPPAPPSQRSPPRGMETGPRFPGPTASTAAARPLRGYGGPTLQKRGFAAGPPHAARAGSVPGQKRGLHSAGGQAGRLQGRAEGWSPAVVFSLAGRVFFGSAGGIAANCRHRGFRPFFFGGRHPPPGDAPGGPEQCLAGGVAQPRRGRPRRGRSGSRTRGNELPVGGYRPPGRFSGHFRRRAPANSPARRARVVRGFRSPLVKQLVLRPAAGTKRRPPAALATSVVIGFGTQPRVPPPRGRPGGWNGRAFAVLAVRTRRAPSRRPPAAPGRRA